jgi:hypothetical protein
MLKDTRLHEECHGQKKSNLWVLSFHPFIPMLPQSGFGVFFARYTMYHRDTVSHKIKTYTWNVATASTHQTNSGYYRDQPISPSRPALASHATGTEHMTRHMIFSIIISMPCACFSHDAWASSSWVASRLQSVTGETGRSCFQFHFPKRSSSRFNYRCARRKIESPLVALGVLSSSSSSSIGGHKKIKQNNDSSSNTKPATKPDGSSKGRRMKKAEIDNLVRGMVNNIQLYSS